MGLASSMSTSLSTGCYHLINVLDIMIVYFWQDPPTSFKSAKSPFNTYSCLTQFVIKLLLVLLFIILLDMVSAPMAIENKLHQLLFISGHKPPEIPQSTMGKVFQTGLLGKVQSLQTLSYHVLQTYSAGGLWATCGQKNREKKIDRRNS